VPLAVGASLAVAAAVVLVSGHAVIPRPRPAATLVMFTVTLVDCPLPSTRARHGPTTRPGPHRGPGPVHRRPLQGERQRPSHCHTHPAHVRPAASREPGRTPRRESGAHT
jgi:hypothetical protein